jgi:hypothetical protein
MAEDVPGGDDHFTADSAERVEEASRLTEDSYVSRVRPDPTQAVRAHTLRGYLGRDIEKGYWRIYPRPDLQEYIKVKEEEILSQAQLPAGDPDLPGGSSIAVADSARLEHVRVIASAAQAGFLTGELTGGLLPGAAGRIGPRGGAFLLPLTPSIASILVSVIVVGEPAAEFEQK